VRGKTVIIEALIPIWIGHEYYYTELSPKHSKGSNVGGNSPVLCKNLEAMAIGGVLAVPLMLTTFPTLSGNNHPAAKLCVAPIELPTLA
jgi:hypothetical protein